MKYDTPDEEEHDRPARVEQITRGGWDLLERRMSVWDEDRALKEAGISTGLPPIPRGDMTADQHHEAQHEASKAHFDKRVEAKATLVEEARRSGTLGEDFVATSNALKAIYREDMEQRVAAKIAAAEPDRSTMSAEEFKQATRDAYQHKIDNPPEQEPPKKDRGIERT